MCDPFLHLLMQVLTRQSHDLLQEDITHCIFKMAEVDFIAFHTDFLSKFLGNVEGITHEQQFTLVEKYKIVQVRKPFVDKTFTYFYCRIIPLSLKISFNLPVTFAIF